MPALHIDDSGSRGIATQHSSDSSSAGVLQEFDFHLPSCEATFCRLTIPSFALAWKYCVHGIERARGCLKHA